MKPLPPILNSAINKGTEYYDSFEEKKYVRLTNLGLLVILVTIFPAIIIHNILSDDIPELIALSFFYFAFIIAFVLNWKGFNQLATASGFLLAIALTYLIVALNESQLGAPFVNLLIAMGAIHGLKNSPLRNTIIILAFISYLLLNYYQLKYLPFDETEFWISSIFLVFMYLTLRYSDALGRNYQRQIEEKNQELKIQNTTIKEQGEALRILEKEKYEKEMALKQKDMDTILANQAMQVKLKENMVDQLNKVVKSENPSKEIRSIILELRGQAETQKKLNLLSDNLEEVNAVLYERLLANHPDLTKSEREMCTYIRLGLSAKEIASIKNITENSVTVLKTRLRKKVKLKNNYELDTYLLKY